MPGRRRPGPSTAGRARPAAGRGFPIGGRRSPVPMVLQPGSAIPVRRDFMHQLVVVIGVVKRAFESGGRPIFLVAGSGSGGFGGSKRRRWWGRARSNSTGLRRVLVL